VTATTPLSQHIFCLLFALLLVILPCYAVAAPIIPAAPTITADSYLLIDFHSGQSLSERDADKRLEPASLTKMMTAHILFEELKENNIELDDLVTISKKAWKMKGSRTFVEVGKKIPVKTLLMGLIVQSGNDATVALAEYIAGSEEVFAAVMNQRAQELGMSNTHFVNSTGMPHKDHYSTARDLSILARSTIEHFPELYKWYKIKEYTYNSISQRNRNTLLWRDETVDGFKTGHTESAGYGLVASAQRDKMRLISIVMGVKTKNTRATESQKLLNYGFRFYETHLLYSKKEAIQQIRIWKGTTEQLPIGIADNLYVTIPKGTYEQLKPEISLPATVIAPVHSDQELGTLQIKLAGEQLDHRPLIALQTIEEGSMISRLIDDMMLLFE